MGLRDIIMTGALSLGIASGVYADNYTLKNFNLENALNYETRQALNQALYERLLMDFSDVRNQLEIANENYNISPTNNNFLKVNELKRRVRNLRDFVIASDDIIDEVRTNAFSGKKTYIFDSESRVLKTFSKGELNGEVELPHSALGMISSIFQRNEEKTKFIVTKERIRTTNDSIDSIISNPNENYFALLINGDTSGETSSYHEENISQARRKLQEIGYQNIFVCAGVGRYNGSSNGIERAVRDLSRKMDNNSKLFVYTTGHGSRHGRTTYLDLEDGQMSQFDFAEEIKKLPFKMILSVHDQCYSGGFLNAMSLINRPGIIISSSDEYNTTYCQPFAINFFNGINNPSYDFNGNGKIEIKELYWKASNAAKAELPSNESNTQITIKN